MIDFLGIRLILQIGPTIPRPAPFMVIDALRSCEVRMNNNGRDGFQLNFAVARDTPFDATLVASGILDPPNRVVVTLLMGSTPEVLVDGIITDVQYSPSSRPGESVLNVTGEDLTVIMDLTEMRRTFEGRPDSAIVLELLAPYLARYQITPMVCPTLKFPLASKEKPTQQGTDLAHIRRLADNNSFVFYLEPMTPGTSRAYWGPDAPAGLPQPAINVGTDSHRPADGAVQGHFNALGPYTSTGTYTEPLRGVQFPIPGFTLAAVPPTLRPVVPLRHTITENTTGLDPAKIALQSAAATVSSRDAVQVSGEIDGVRYGAVLRSRRLVGMRGMGLTWDGLYRVEQVTHHIRPGEHKQKFTLKRSGFISSTPVVRS